MTTIEFNPQIAQNIFGFKASPADYKALSNFLHGMILSNMDKDPQLAADWREVSRIKQVLMGTYPQFQTTGHLRDVLIARFCKERNAK